jgi:tRNA(fMet)-specific endonuclease VapC
VFLLDTDTCIDILRGLNSVVRKIAQMSPDDCAVSSITVFELYSGALVSARPDVEQHKVDGFVAPLTIIVFDGTAAREAAKLRADLKRRGSSIGPYDLLIAAEAIRSRLTLVSSNLSEFRRIRSLQVETWRT